MPRKPKPKPHRAHGDGTWKESPDGSWRGAITVRQPDGSSRRVYRRGQSEAEIIQRLADARDGGTGGQRHASGDTLLRDFLARWLDDTAKHSIAPRTYESYELHVRKLSAGIGGTRLRDLRADAVQAFYSRLINEGMGTGTIRITHAVLHRSLKQARRWGLVPINVAEDVDLPRKPARDIDPFTPAQTVQLITYAEDNPTNLSACWILLATTGMRIGEALGLRWDDIDLAAPRLLVSVQLNRTGQLVPLKTRGSRRPIDLLTRTVAALRAHRLRQAEEQLAGGWAASPLVFRNAHGQPWSHRMVEHTWVRVLKAAGLPHKKLHALRHGVTTYLLKAGVDARGVATILGHASPAMTLDVYGHDLPGSQSDAMARLEALLARKPG